MSSQYKIRFRALNAVLGLWLFISAFLWPHLSSQKANALVVGALAIVFAGIAAFKDPRARYLNAVLGAWLAVSTYALPALSKASRWNDLFVAFAMLACAIAPLEPRRLHADV